jgi:hypothetical protein
MPAKFLLISAAAGVLPFAPTARATLLYYDSFNYAVQGTTWNIANSLGQNQPWDPAHLGHAGDPVQPWGLYQNGSSGAYVGAGSLSYPGLAVDPNPNSNNAHYRGDGNTGGSGDDYRWFGQPTTWNGNTTPGSGAPPFTTYAAHPATSVTLYYSFVLQVSQFGTLSTVSSGGGFSNGQVMAGFTDAANDTNQTAQGNTAGALMFRPTDDNASSTTYQLGIGAASGSSSVSNSDSVWLAPSNFALNQTLFIVVAYTMNPTTNTNVAKLYINPTPGSLESSNTVSAQTVPGVHELEAGLNGFVLKDDTHMPSGMSMDELRIGDTWADVTPSAPEPTAIALLGAPAVLTLSRRRRRA